MIRYEEIAYMKHRLIRFAEECYRLSKNKWRRQRCLRILARLYHKQDLSNNDFQFITRWSYMQRIFELTKFDTLLRKRK